MTRSKRARIAASLNEAATQLRELADQIENEPGSLFEFMITVDPLMHVPRLKALTVRVRIKPDGESA